ncbi:unnamed protein product [Auanema sp. JU1783]|nr:unnamed protein product [Auanema sp. JU1783]
MGNTQPGGLNKRDRPGEGYSGGATTPSRNKTYGGSTQPFGSTAEDGCPVQVKIAKSDEECAVTPTVQFKESNEYPVVFKWPFTATNQPNRVYISGSWDNWKQRIPLVKSTNDFSTILELVPGQHEYKFMVDSKWVIDDQSPKLNNGLGGENNCIIVDEADFEVFIALDKDLASSSAGEAMRGVSSQQTTHDTPNEKELEKHRTFSQDIPDKKEFERAHNPPVLPPHLLQVILNKDTPMTCDPNVLPEPNHVMLNHLYALSIKDGVMVLSATHRYRKKYVTTLLYKPI